jgi:hypothetical protein
MRNPEKYKKFSNKDVAPGIQVVLGIVDGSKFTEDKFKTTLCQDGILFDGRDGSEAQAYRFAKAKFTPAEAKVWLKAHKLHYIMFESARNGDARAVDRASLKIDLPQHREYTDEGYLIAPCRISHPGVFEYYGYELPQDIPGLEKMKIYKIYMPASVLFDPDTMASAENKPFVNEHKDVDPETWQARATGIIRDVHEDEEHYLAGVVVVMDAETLADIDKGKKELSAGYDQTLVRREDVPDNKDIPADVDFVRTVVRVNHVALVDEGRAGHECKIMDQKEKNVEELKALLTQVMAGITKLIAMEEAEAAAAKPAAGEEEDKGIKEKDDKIACMQKEMDELKSGLPAAVEKAAEDRASIVHDSMILMPTIETKGKTNKQLMVEVLQSKHQDCASMIDAILGGADMAHDSVDETVIRSAFRAVCTTSEECGFGKAVAAAKPAESAAKDEKPKSYGDQLWALHHPKA